MNKVYHAILGGRVVATVDEDGKKALQANPIYKGYIYKAVGEEPKADSKPGALPKGVKTATQKAETDGEDNQPTEPSAANSAKRGGTKG